MGRPAVAVAVPHSKMARVSVQDQDVVSCLEDCLSEVESAAQEGTCPIDRPASWAKVCLSLMSHFVPWHRGRDEEALLGAIEPWAAFCSALDSRTFHFARAAVVPADECQQYPSAIR